MSNERGPDTEPVGQQPDPVRDSESWTDYHVGTGVVCKQWSSRRVFDLGQRTNHTVLQAVLQPKSTESNNRVEWPARAVPHSKQHPAEPVCSHRVETTGTAHASPGAGRRGNIEPLWGALPGTVAKCRSRKHWSQIEEPAGSPLGIKRSRGPLGSAPSHSTGRLSTHCDQRFHSPQLNTRRLAICVAQERQKEMECILRVVLTGMGMNSYRDCGTVGRLRVIPGLFTAREFSSLVCHVQLQKGCEHLRPPANTVLQSEVNHVFRVLHLISRPLPKRPQAPDGGCGASEGSTAYSYAVFCAQWEAHALNCGAYANKTDALAHLSGYFKTRSPPALNEYGRPGALLHVVCTARDKGFSLCTFQVTCATAAELYGVTLGIKATLVYLEAVCCRQIQLLTMTPEETTLPRDQQATYFKQPATLAIKGPAGSIAELLTGMAVQAFLACPVEHGARLGAAVWQVFRLVLWHDQVELKHHCLFDFVHANVQRRLLYLLDAWCTAYSDNTAMTAMLQPAFYWKELHSDKRLRNLKPFRMQLQRRLQKLGQPGSNGAKLVQRIQLHKAFPAAKLSSSTLKADLQKLCSCFLMSAQQHVPLLEEDLPACEFDICGVPISLSVDSIYLAATALLINDADLPLHTNDADGEESRPPSLHERTVLHSLQKCEAAGVKSQLHRTRHITAADTSLAGKWTGFRLMLQQPARRRPAIHRATWQELTNTGDVRHFDCEWNNYTMPQEEEKLQSAMLAMHQRMQLLSEGDPCNNEAKRLHLSCTKMNRKLKQLSEQQSRSIVLHTVLEQEALEPCKKFPLAAWDPPCNISSVASYVSEELCEAVLQGLQSARIAASQFIFHRWVVVGLDVLLPDVDTTEKLERASLSVPARQFLLATQERCGMEGISELYIQMPDKLCSADPSSSKARMLVLQLIKSLPGWRNVAPSIRLTVLTESNITQNFKLRHSKLSVMRATATDTGIQLQLARDCMPWDVSGLPAYLKCDSDSELNNAVLDWLPNTAHKRIPCMNLIVHTHLRSSGLWDNFGALLALARPCAMCSTRPKHTRGDHNICKMLHNLACQELQHKWCAPAGTYQPQVVRALVLPGDLYKLSQLMHNSYPLQLWGTDIFPRVQSKLYGLRAVMNLLDSCIQELDYAYIEKHCTWLFSPANTVHSHTTRFHRALKEEAATTPAPPLRQDTCLQFKTTVLQKLHGDTHGLQINYTLNYMMYQMLLHDDDGHGVLHNLQKLDSTDLRRQLTALRIQEIQDMRKIVEVEHKLHDLNFLPQLALYCWNITMCQVYLWYVTLLLPLRQESDHYRRMPTTETVRKDEGFCFYRRMLYVMATRSHMCEFLTKHLHCVIPESLGAPELLNQLTHTAHRKLPPYADKDNLQFVSRCREERAGVPCARSLLKEFCLTIEFDYTTTLHNLKVLQRQQPNEYFSKLLAAAGHN